MPIPFRDAEEITELGAAGYLKFAAAPDGRLHYGALLLINARGEPLEFSYSQIELPPAFLWRAGDLRRHAVRQLTVSLLSASPGVPRLLICLAEEVHPELFAAELHLTTPVCRIAALDGDSPPEDGGGVTLEDGSTPLRVLWQPAPPPEGSLEAALLRRLAQRGLLREPFERALIGLTEVYSLSPARGRSRA